jgi:DNA replication and repair protein RecF
MLTDIRLQNFRSYEDDSFELSPGVNVIVGPNASGKTNLLEGVLFLAHSSSYRAKDMELIRFEAPWARLDAHTQTGSRIAKLDNQTGIIKKTFEIDGQPYQRLSLHKTIPVVLFEPNHLLLLVGSPDMRRNFLDELIEQIVPGFASTRQHYRRALSQRNSLLKKGLRVAAPQVFVWNLRLSELGGKIANDRMKLLDKINTSATGIYQGLSGTKATVQLDYKSSCNIQQYESSLLKKLEDNLERDCLVGYTTSGPHRDDVVVSLNNRAAEDTASRGETRTIVLMLKIVEAQVLEESRGTSPLLLLDDVFSELDGARRHALTAYVQSYQTFITTTDADLVVKNFTQACNVIPLG